MKVALKESQIKKLIQKPKNEGALKSARDNEKKLHQFYNDSYPELIFNEVKPLLTAQKFSKFKQVYKNHSQTLVDKVLKHYRRIFNAHGKKMVAEYELNPDLTNAFSSNVRSGLFGKMADEEYFKTNYVRLAITEPNSVFFIGTNEEGKIQCYHIKLCDIHDIDADHSGIRYAIIKKVQEQENGDKITYYFSYDDFNYAIFKESKDGLETLQQLTPHMNLECPVIWVYDESCKLDNDVEKSSVLTDSIKDFLEYNILKTFYSNYKYFSAFGRDIKPETRCSYKDPQSNIKCSGGTLVPINEHLEVRYPREGQTTCPSCSGKNEGVMGEVFVIPIAQQGNAEYLSNLQKMHFRIEADSSILTFHKDDIKDLHQSILDDVIGAGFGTAYKDKAVNEQQVLSNFDDQETNLDVFREKAEGAWEKVLKRSAEIYNPSAFYCNLFLGDKYFLKTVDQLYSELESIYKGGSNTATIEKKQLEILLTENKHDDSLMKRHELIKVLKPFSSLPLAYIEKNRATLNNRRVELYENFEQVLAIYEQKHGKVEDLLLDDINTDLVLRNLLRNLNEIFNQIVPENDRQEENSGQPRKQEAAQQS